MGFSTLKNTPVVIDLLVQGNSRGWSVAGGKATHENCNAGKIELKGIPFVSGASYVIHYIVESIAGTLQLHLGAVSGTLQTTAGSYSETLVSDGTGAYFYATGDCVISGFSIQKVESSTDSKQSKTIVWNEAINKWSCFKPISADSGFSLFSTLFSFKNGQLYKHSLLATRNNLYGNQYKTIVNFVASANQGQPKTFESISYEGNQLLISTTDGIQTSLGQLSDLSEPDFLRDILDDGVTTVNIYSKEGIYSAGFLRDKAEDLINGSPLKGTHITIELQTVDTGVLKLKNIRIHSEPSPIGSR